MAAFSSRSYKAYTPGKYCANIMVAENSDEPPAARTAAVLI